jgi:flagellar biosynthesis protein FliQ
VLSETVLFDILKESLWVALVISMPILTVALVVGLAIGLIQALTSVQEMTLTFVPKMAAIVAAYWMSMNFSSQMLVRLYQEKIIPLVAGF